MTQFPVSCLRTQKKFSSKPWGKRPLELLYRRLQEATPSSWWLDQICEGACACKSLTMTYFHTGIRTIIGAEAFHGPVRNGKAWDHLAMATRHKLYKLLEAITSKFTYWPVESCISLSLRVAQSDSNDRIKPHEQLVSVSLTPHSASTPDLSTSWSRTTLQGGQASREVSSSGKFPA